MPHTETDLALAVPAVDILLDYLGLYGWPSRCRLRLFQPPSGPVLIATELTDNPGTSITNAIEKVAETACHRLELDPTKLTVVEHYGADSWRHDDEFSRVDLDITVDAARTPPNFRITSPRWAHLPKPALESLLGGRLA